MDRPAASSPSAVSAGYFNVLVALPSLKMMRTFSSNPSGISYLYSPSLPQLSPAETFVIATPGHFAFCLSVAALESSTYT